MPPLCGAGSLTRGVGQKRFYDDCKQRFEAAGPIDSVVCTPGRVLYLGLPWPWTMDSTGHECLLLFRDLRIGFGFCRRCHSRFLKGVSGCEERIPSHRKLGLVGGGPCNANLAVAALIMQFTQKAQPQSLLSVCAFGSLPQMLVRCCSTAEAGLGTL
jgi:hypothetical protein